VKVELREDYQVPAFDSMRAAIAAGAKSILVNAPTGSGKTVIASALMEMVVAKGRRANFVVDRLSLIDQTSATFDKYGLPHGVIQADHPRYRPSLPIQVCSVQTLTKRGWPDAEIDVIDEAHILHKAVKTRILAKRGITIGMTATPFTKGLGKWFEAVVNVTTTRRLIEQGWLVPYRVFSCAEPDMSNVTVRTTGEWDEREASGAALEVVGNVVDEYLKHGEGRKFICSGVDTIHVEELQRQFLAAGINVSTYTYLDDADDRADTTTEFRKADSTIRGLITVTAASRGFDVPDVACVIMARPLRKSLAEHIQLLGRGLRICKDKTDCLVLDHSGNMARFWRDCEGFFDDGIEQLDDGSKKDKPKPKEQDELEAVKCPQCRALHKPAPMCPACGHQYPKRAAVEHVPGTLRELVAGNYTIELDRDIWPQVCGYACAAQADPLLAEKRALAIYKKLTGHWPTVSFGRTRPKPPGKDVLGQIKRNQVAYRKAMGKWASA
jgi:superfamily II DNA or RNA helicase